MQELFDAITSVLLYEAETSYSKLYSKVTELLPTTLSHRDFSSHLKKMVKENELIKRIHSERGGQVCYSLTETGKKRYQLKILGTGEKPEQYRRLYQLLFLYELYGSDYNITDEDLDKFLSYVPASREQLVAENVYRAEDGAEFICYKPLRDIRIISTKIKEINNGKLSTISNYLGFQ